MASALLLGVMLAINERLVASVASKDREPISCYQAHTRCRGDVSCGILLKTMQQMCDKSISSCQTTDRMHCHTVLTSLQQHPHFRDCTCSSLAYQPSRCREIQESIFYHECLKIPGSNQTNPQRPGHQGSLQTNFVEDVSNMSCIELHTLCIGDSTCSQHLNAFNKQCRVDTQSNTCIASSWKRCHAAIEGMHRVLPALLSCKCKGIQNRRTAEECTQIRKTISKNACQAWAPYFLHVSESPQVASFADLISAAGFNSVGLPQTVDFSDRSTCTSSLWHCYKNKHCGTKLALIIEHCAGDVTMGTCDRSACLEAVRNFFLVVRPEYTQPLALCKCNPKDNKCALVQMALRPSCAVVEWPPPSCQRLLDRCLEDTDCGTRWRSFKKHCSTNKDCSRDLEGMRCRRSWLDIQSTIVATNCTCSMVDDVTLCADAQQQLQGGRICLDAAAAGLHKQLAATDVGSRQPAAVPQNSECMRSLAKDSAHYLEPPQVIRKYSNESDCSEVCECPAQNSSLLCKRLPCAHQLPCTLNGQAFEHGENVDLQDRSPCRCIRAEIVCSRPDDLPSPSQASQAGLFLHVGFSVSELYLLEEHTSLRLRPRGISSKFAAMLNGDSAQQFCTSELDHDEEGYLRFRVSVSPLSAHQNGDQACLHAAQQLSLNINNRDRTIITDAELSLMKVAQLEKVEFHEHLHRTPPKRPLTDRPRAPRPLSAGCSSTTSLAWLVTVLALSIAL